MHPRYEVDRALLLVGDGLNDSQVSRATGINRTTIAEWRRDGPPGRRDAAARSSCPRCEGRRLDAVAYAFLLGMYLGDGSIAHHPRAYKLRVVQDARYPNSIEEIRRAMATVRHCELDRIRTVQHVGCVEVYTYWRHWPCVFPPTWSGDEASAQDRADSLAGVDRRRAAGEPSPRVDPFGRMPRDQPSWEGEVRLPEISLLEPIGGHPSDLPGGMRFGRRSSYESQT